MASSVPLPLVVWHGFSNPDTTCLISSYPYVYEGQKDGTIWVYTLTQATPPMLKYKLLLMGHKTSVVALCILKTKTDTFSLREDILISASEDGEISRWSALDGRCLTTNTNGFFGVPNQLKLFKFSEKYLFCCGQSNEISILNATTLEVVRVWGGHLNWVTCTEFHDTVTNCTRLATLTMEGQLDVWDFDISKQIVLKDQSATYEPLKDKQDHFDIAFDLINHEHIPGLCMALARRNVILFLLSGTAFIPNIKLTARPETDWLGGVFCGLDRFVLWTQDGVFYDYLLNPPTGVKPGSLVEQEQLYYSTHLLNTYSFNNQGLPLSLGSFNMTICQTPETPIAVLFCSRPTESVFCLTSLASTDQGKSLPSNDPITVCASASFSDIWCVNKQKDPIFGHITTSIPVNNSHLALGYENGAICIVPIATAMLNLSHLSQCHNKDSTKVFENAHEGEVTCLIVPENHQVAGHHYLLSGGRDGAVKIWNLVDGEHIASFMVHALPVDIFVEPTEQTDSRIRGCIVSIARDHSLALISVESMNCLFIFPGHTSPLKAIQWRTAEDYIVLGYTDEIAFVWQIQTAHLDRTLTGKQCRDVFEDDRWPINHFPAQTHNSKTPSSAKQTISIRPLVSTTKKIFAHIFTFNMRRLVHDVYTHLPSLTTREVSGFLAPLALKPSLSGKSVDSIIHEPLLLKFDKEDPLDSTFDTHNISKQKAKVEWREKRLELISIVITTAMSWYISEALEDVCRKTLNVTPNKDNCLNHGLRGANGYFSLLAPLEDEKDAWKISPSMTAIRLLSIALLSKAIVYVAGKNNHSSDMLSGYALALPAVVGKDYCFPSLSLLSKYWQDTSARSIFSSAVMGQSKEDLAVLIDYWEIFLPTSNSPENTSSHRMVRAAIILGIMGCDHAHVLGSSVRKSTALSLTLLLSDTDLDMQSNGTSDQAVSSVSVARTLASMELLSQGFSTWISYVNAAEVLRTIFAYAADPQPSMASISRGAKQAIFTIASTNMPLVIGTLTYDTMHSKKMEERIQCLTMIGYFIIKKPLLLYPSINRVVEAVVKTLDPNVPHMREVVLPSATAILHDLVKTYPCVGFSSTSQKLAVGTQEGATVIYDLRTATRSIVLEGHKGPIDGLAFSPEGKFIATCSILDQTVRVWYSNLSLFGMLTSSLAQGLGQTRTETRESREISSNIQKPYKIFSFANSHNTMELPDVVMKVRFEWTSSRCVKLNIGDFVMSFPV
ncbi:hypothetical protein BDF14DRAFT_1761428 [Spinellus fusiger]|nr:hypothetical protein BDF14DRAFT_1761428 [Spinellus fusiger]